jgi:hypothetical protein
MDAVRDGYLVPMRLLEQIDGQYRVPDLAGHELVEALFEMIVDAPTPSSVYARFKKAPYGLRQSHVEALLALMHALGRVDICGPVSWRDGWSSLPHPMQYMRIVATPGRTEPKA